MEGIYISPLTDQKNTYVLGRRKNLNMENNVKITHKIPVKGYKEVFKRIIIALDSRPDEFVKTKKLNTYTCDLSSLELLVYTTVVDFMKNPSAPEAEPLEQKVETSDDIELTFLHQLFNGMIGDNDLVTKEDGKYVVIFGELYSRYEKYMESQVGNPPIKNNRTFGGYITRKAKFLKKYKKNPISYEITDLLFNYVNQKTFEDWFNTRQGEDVRMVHIPQRNISQMFFEDLFSGNIREVINDIHIEHTGVHGQERECFFLSKRLLASYKAYASDRQPGQKEMTAQALGMYIKKNVPYLKRDKTIVVDGENHTTYKIHPERESNDDVLEQFMTWVYALVV